jgi:hypothetical protein
LIKDESLRRKIKNLEASVVTNMISSFLEQVRNKLSPLIGINLTFSKHASLILLIFFFGLYEYTLICPGEDKRMKNPALKL